MWPTHSDTVCSAPSRNSSSRSLAGSPSARKNLATSSTPSAATGSRGRAGELADGVPARPSGAGGESACCITGHLLRPPYPIHLDIRLRGYPYIHIFALANLLARPTGPRRSRGGTRSMRRPRGETIMLYDLAIVGSGGAAFAAAIAASDAGASVVMIERGLVGGTCVNTGCVPSKALLAAAAARHDAASQPFPGITTQAGPVDMAALTGGKDGLVAAMRASKYTGLAADYGWQIIPGTARFAGGPDAPVLQVRLNDGGTTTFEAGHYLVATGSAPWIPPIGGLANTGYLTSTTAMELTGLPQSMLVIGGNAVGLELAQLFARLGVSVT